jgi:hypothetical protein
MKTILVLAVLFSVAAGQTLQRRPDGGVWDQPHKNPLTLREADVDTLMWPIVQRINQSEWIWTTESCQGHDDRGNHEPLLGLVTNDIGRALAALSDAVIADGARNRVRDTQDPHGLQMQLSFFVRPYFASLGRYQVRIVFPGPPDRRSRILQMLRDFAEHVNPDRGSRR